MLRTNIDRPCLLDTKKGTLIWGLFFSLGPSGGLGLFSKEASQAGDLGDKPVAFISGTGGEKVSIQAPSSTKHVGQGPGRAASSSYDRMFRPGAPDMCYRKLSKSNLEMGFDPSQ